jgi:hypothetical protein
MDIGKPFNVVHGTSSSSPIVKIDAKARSKVNWTAAALDQKVQAVFESFVEVFRESHWHYAAGSFPGMQVIPILMGQQTMQQLEAQFNAAPSMDCGRIRNLLAVAMQALLPVTTADARITGHFITKKMGILPAGVRGSFECIDRNVYGNVRLASIPFQMVGQCIFEDHYAVRVNETGLTYDACLVSIYPDINVVVDTLLKKSPANPDQLIPRTPPRPGGPPVTSYQALKNESPNGFSMGYMRS